MLHIERMRMQLPPGFRHRASMIARLVGEYMAETHLSNIRSLDRLSISPVRIPPDATDQEIAHRVAERIASALEGRT